MKYFLEYLNKDATIENKLQSRAKGELSKVDYTLIEHCWKSDYERLQTVYSPILI